MRLHRYLLFFFCYFFISTLVYYLGLAEFNYFVDLRNRIIGSRLMDLGMDPYYFKWSKAWPLTLCDPIDICNFRNNLTTSPPSLLWLIRPIARLDYMSIGYIWVLLHYLFFLLIVLPIHQAFRDEASKTRVLAAAIILLLTPQWSETILKGQCHFFLPTAMSLMIFTAAGNDRYKYFICGLLLSVAVWLRPNAILLAPFLLFYRPDKKQFFGAIALAAILLGTMEWYFHFNDWVSFYHTCSEWVKNNVADITVIFCHGDIVTEGKSLEGSTRALDYISNQSEQGNIFHLVQSKWNYSVPPLPMLVVFICTFAVLVWFSFRYQFRNMHDALFIGYFAYWMAALTSPILRLTYYFPEVFPIILIFAGNYFQMNRTERYVFHTACILLVLDLIPVNLVVAESLFIGCMLLYTWNRRERYSSS